VPCQRLVELAHVAVHVAQVVVGVGQAFLVAGPLADDQRLEVVLERVGIAAGIRLDQAQRVVTLRLAPLVARLHVQPHRLEAALPRLVEMALAAVAVGDVVLGLSFAAQVLCFAGRRQGAQCRGQGLVGIDIAQRLGLGVELGDGTGGAWLGMGGHRDAGQHHDNRQASRKRSGGHDPRHCTNCSRGTNPGARRSRHSAAGDVKMSRRPPAHAP